jgi:hypothetical protein
VILRVASKSCFLGYAQSNYVKSGQFVNQFSKYQMAKRLSSGAVTEKSQAVLVLSIRGFQNMAAR